MKIVHSPKCQNYYAGRHSERPERVRNIYKFLKEKKFEFVKPEHCSEQDLGLVHSEQHIENIKKGNRAYLKDPESPALPNIYYYATLAAGAAIKAARLALEGEGAFSLMRPPGHHAHKEQAEGFCYFNNIAIAVSRLLKEEKVQKVAILDIDAHHGNGTQEIFEGDPRVLYVSLHQSHLWPVKKTGRGLESKLNCFNYPLKPGTDESGYLKKLDESLRYIKKSKPKPDLLAVSAGFDTHRADRLTRLRLETSSYKKIAFMINFYLGGVPTFAVLEGGYSKNLPECVYSFLTELENFQQQVLKLEANTKR